MAGYLGSKAVLLSTTAAVVTGDMTVAGATTLSGAFTSLGIDDNAVSTAITIDGSQNVGIGGSPSAWSSVVRVLEFDGQAADYIGFNSNASGYVYQNGYYNGTNNIYKNSAAASAYGQVSGVHQWFTAPSGTAGNAISFTEAMRIDSSGNVGIGTSSPASALQVVGGVENNQTTKGVHLGMLASSYAVIEMVGAAGGDGWIDFKDTNDTDYSERVRGGTGKMEFHTNGTEAMRIDSSGGLTLSPATAANPKLIQNCSNNTTAISFRSAGAERGSIYFLDSGVSYNTSSDYRLKENVTPIQGAADTVMAMQPCTYTAIADGLWYDGFLAHELQEVHPRAVQGTKDAMRDEEYEITPAVEATYAEDGTVLTEAVPAAMGTRSVPDMQSVDYSKLTPILTAALQEALTEIAALKVRVAALEATP